jgi:hypothetical protein
MMMMMMMISPPNQPYKKWSLSRLFKKITMRFDFVLTPPGVLEKKGTKYSFQDNA